MFGQCTSRLVRPAPARRGPEVQHIINLEDPAKSMYDKLKAKIENNQVAVARTAFGSGLSTNNSRTSGRWKISRNISSSIARKTLTLLPLVQDLTTLSLRGTSRQAVTREVKGFRPMGHVQLRD